MGSCSVQGYGEKSPGIGAFVYPGSGATCDTRPASAGTTAVAVPADEQPCDLPAVQEVSCGCRSCLEPFQLFKLHYFSNSSAQCELESYTLLLATAMQSLLLCQFVVRIMEHDLFQVVLV